MKSHLLYTVIDAEEISAEASLRGVPLHGEDLDAVVSALPSHYERHEALALLHALSADPDVAATAIGILTAQRRTHYLRLHARALPEGWDLWDPNPPSSEGVRILAPPDEAGDRYEYASIPTADVEVMHRLLDEAISSIPDPAEAEEPT